VSELGPFTNEPVLELRRAAVRSSLAQVLEDSERAGPVQVPVRIGEGERHGEEIISVDPGDPSRLVATAASATAAEVDEAVELARQAATGWAKVPAGERAAMLRRAAAWLRERRLEVAALEVRECAKPWAEADADVCEAIDYLEYYARGALELDRGGEVLQAPGEHNRLSYAGRGVVGVIAPWNFPVAIPMGMTAAALASGNTAVLKPAEQSPACGAVVVAALRAGGVPAEVLALLPGEGPVGAALVSHRDVATIAFTGSLAVGLEVVRAAAIVQPGQRQLKRVVAEFGGKNCVIVASDADLDEAVPAILASAFSYAGQKCSAASRVLVAERVADHFLERLVGAASVLVVGQARELATEVPPLIEQEALERVVRYGAISRESGQVLAELATPPGPGYFAPPMLVSGLPPDSPVLREEIFGPILAIEGFGELEEALTRIDELPFALTAGLFSRDPVAIAQVAAAVPAGNLYVNRATTGAMVGRQPFGGNRLSGNGTKAGGPDYLRHFVDPKVISENTMRHGLVV
jgi:RHH-type proline utilization regulon transcriptional repressor/proline dehydrogenase/delta 1-pyrroline-5-carboxylate dehydrogenase